jgi:hypothetical protein
MKGLADAATENLLKIIRFLILTLKAEIMAAATTNMYIANLVTLMLAADLSRIVDK